MALVASEDNPEKEKEKQILIDPISLRDGVDKLDAPNLTHGHPPPPLPTPKFKFISSTVPNSASSTPRFNAPVTTNNKARSLLKSYSSTNQQCAGRSRVALGSMSYGPCDDMDRCWRSSPNTGELVNKKCISKIEDKTWVKPPNAAELQNKSISKMEEETKWRDSSKETGPDENQFKCGALCLFLPGLGKGKPVQAKNDDSDMDNVNVISRRVSFEKFECGSWASSAMLSEIGDDGNSGSLYFDLPLELIRNSVDAHAPVNSAFVFNKDRKGILNQ